jgi:hypothetical protein
MIDLLATILKIISIKSKNGNIPDPPTNIIISPFGRNYKPKPLPFSPSIKNVYL